MTMKMMHVLYVLCLMVKLSDSTAPAQWTKPSINSENGTGTLAETLPEGLTVGDILGSVEINNSPKHYEILSQTYAGMFNVTVNADKGDIYLINNTYLDFEMDTSLTVVIKGSNGDGFGVLTLTILVTDTNDNTPTFSAMSYSVNIAATVANDSVIFTAMASDVDSTVNNDLTYSIFSGDDATNRFSIAASTGIVKRSGEDFASSKYELVIYAIDGGSSALTGSTTLSVCIDCNGGAPVMMSVLTLMSGLLLSTMLGTMPM